MPPIALGRSRDVVTAFGYIWAGLMFATAAANAALAVFAGPGAWSAFIVTFPLASKLALVLVQYGFTRAITVRRVRADRLQAA